MTEYWLLLDDNSAPLVVRVDGLKLLAVFTNEEAARAGMSGSIGAPVGLEKFSRSRIIEMLSAYDGAVRDYRPDLPVTSHDAESL